MNVVVFGAGTVGTSIAELLCANRQDVTIVDSDRESLSLIEDRLDVQAVFGSACDAVTLFQAGVQSADLCLAVTSLDEINLIGGSLAKAMGAKRSVARIFNPSYRDFSTFDYERHFKIDRLLSLEHLTALELAKSIRTPGLFAIENFARGGVEVQEVAVEKDSRAVGKLLRDMKLPREVRIGLITNERGTVIAGANHAIHAGDHVTLIGQEEHIEDVKRLFEHKSPPQRNVVIAGGGEIGYNLALNLQRNRYQVLILEADAKRCNYLAEKLRNVTVLHADATRRAEMEEARVGRADVFVAATGHDEDNIVCGVEAKELGSRRIMSIIRRPDYTNVLAKLGIDFAVSPREVMARQILGMVFGGPLLGRSIIAGGAAEVWEVEVHVGVPATEVPLKELVLGQSLIAAIVRENYVHVPGGDDQLRPGDNAVVLVQRDNVDHTLKLFQGGKRKSLD